MITNDHELHELRELCNSAASVRTSILVLWRGVVKKKKKKAILKQDSYQAIERIPGSSIVAASNNPGHIMVPDCSMHTVHGAHFTRAATDVCPNLTPFICRAGEKSLDASLKSLGRPLPFHQVKVAQNETYSRTMRYVIWVRIKR
jgi:hypothetical protein